MPEMPAPVFILNADSVQLEVAHDAPNIILTAENPETGARVEVPVLRPHLPAFLYAASGGAPDESQVLSAQLEADRVESGERTAADVAAQARTLLLTLATLEERAVQAAHDELMDVDVVDEIDDMSRAEAIALAKELRDATTPYAMARWAAQNAELVAKINAGDYAGAAGVQRAAAATVEPTEEQPWWPESEQTAPQPCEHGHAC